MKANSCFAFTPSNRRGVTTRQHVDLRKMVGDEDDKFSFGQRIESLKCVVVGALSGGICLTPITALHDIAFSKGGAAQWEFDTDMGSLEAALFAIVYRYCIRKDENPMLNQGVTGAFVLTRTLSRIRVPSYCTAAPLSCKNILDIGALFLHESDACRLTQYIFMKAVHLLGTLTGPW